MEVGNHGVRLDVWVDGQFATIEAMPKCVEVACVIRSYQGMVNQEDLSNFHFLIEKDKGGWLVENQYRCSIKLKLMHYDVIEKYNDRWFEEFDYYNNDGKRSGIFTISL